MKQILSAIILALSFQTPVYAQTATFSAINDARAGVGFSSSSTISLAPNTLSIGVESGFDVSTYKYRDFKVSVAAYYSPTMTDTIAFTVTAPVGYRIVSVTYNENLIVGVSRAGRAFASTQLVVGGKATEAHSLTGLSASSLSVAISTALSSAGTDAAVGPGTVVVGLAAN